MIIYTAQNTCVYDLMRYTIKLSKIKWYENELQKAKSIQYD